MTITVAPLRVRNWVPQNITFLWFFWWIYLGIYVNGYNHAKKFTLSLYLCLCLCFVAHNFDMKNIQKNRQKKVFLQFLTSKIKTLVCICSHQVCEQTHTAVLILDVKKGRKTFCNSSLFILTKQYFYASRSNWTSLHVFPLNVFVFPPLYKVMG